MFLVQMDAESGNPSYPEWRLQTAKSLRRTLPFDSNAAILFVTGTCTQESKDAREGETSPATFSLTGEDAKSFYESVVSDGIDGRTAEPTLQSEDKAGLSTVCGTDGKLEQRKFRVGRKRTQRLERSHPIDRRKKRTFSLLEVFRHAQEGNLVQLATALDQGMPDLNTTDDFGWTVLMCASCAGHMTVVEFLMDRGAKWRGVVDKRGFDAPGLARYAGHESVARFIENYKSSKETLQSSNPTEVAETISDSFYCDVCRFDVESSSKANHSSSTVHQFSCQHKPKVSAYMLPQTNRGFQMMLHNGWNPDRGLGSEGQGRQFPIKTVLKHDRLGLGMASRAAKHPHVTHFPPMDQSAVRNQRWRPSGTGGGRKGKGSKKERLQELKQERGWEIRLRRYMNSD